MPPKRSWFLSLLPQITTEGLNLLSSTQLLSDFFFNESASCWWVLAHPLTDLAPYSPVSFSVDIVSTQLSSSLKQPRLSPSRPRGSAPQLVTSSFSLLCFCAVNQPYLFLVRAILVSSRHNRGGQTCPPISRTDRSPQHGCHTMLMADHVEALQRLSG